MREPGTMLTPRYPSRSAPCGGSGYPSRAMRLSELFFSFLLGFLLLLLALPAEAVDLRLDLGEGPRLLAAVPKREVPLVAGQMIVRALTRSTSNVDQMISALEGWSFTGPKGQQSIRSSDHAMLQPMFQVKLVQSGNRYATAVTKRLRAKYTAPPEKR